jgi:DNA-binding IclR family transcriptional regulator
LNVFESLTEPVSAQELEARIAFLSRAQLFRILNKLSKYGFLEKSMREYEFTKQNGEVIKDSRKNCTVYSLANTVKLSPLNIPTWEQMQEKLKNNEIGENNDID